MKTRQILIALLILGGTTFLNAQEDTVADSRPFLERFYAEGNYGAFLFSDMTHIGLAYIITPRHYLGLEHVPFLRAGNISGSAYWGAFDGWGVQYQYRVRNLFFIISGGMMSEGHYHTKDSTLDYFPADPPAPFPYFRVGIKQCFLRLLCLGCQYTQTGFYKGFAYDNNGLVPHNYYEWEERIRSFTISIGVFLQTSPQ